MASRLLPAEMTIIPADKPKESTAVVYESMEFDIPQEKETFSLRNLQR